MRRMRWIAIGLATIFLSSTAMAESTFHKIKSQFHLDAGLNVKGFIDGPSARIYDPEAKSDQDIDVSREPSIMMEEDLNFVLRHKWFSLDGLALIRGKSLTPEMLGLKLELLSPVSRLWSDEDYLKLGLFHYSDHNIRGGALLSHSIDTDAAVVKVRLWHNSHCDIWPEAYYFMRGKEFANVVTKEAYITKEFFETNGKSSEVLASTGVQVRYFDWFIDARSALKSRMSNHGLDSLQWQTELLMPLSAIWSNSEWARRFEVGGYGAYRRNVSNTNVFGTDEWIGGLEFYFSLSSPSPATRVGSDLF